jgi:hypothetical protein
MYIRSTCTEDGTFIYTEGAVTHFTDLRHTKWKGQAYKSRVLGACPICGENGYDTKRGIFAHILTNNGVALNCKLSREEKIHAEI